MKERQSSRIGAFMRTLVIASHMDDEVYSCGALIHERVRAGGIVAVICMFGRVYDYGRSDGLGDEIIDFLKAKKVLGYHEHRMIVKQEGEPQLAGYYSLLEPIETALKEIGPDEVIVPAPTDLNQDHNHLAKVCDIALRPYNLGSVTRILEARAFDGPLREPSYFLVHHERAMSAKVEASECYRRERRGGVHVRSPDNMIALHRVLGARCGASYAEGYGVKLWRGGAGYEGGDHRG